MIRRVRVAGAGALGTAIRARLDEFGLPARRFTAAGYISAATLSRVFAGQDTLRDPARAAELERGLGWRPGSINAVRAGRPASTIPVPTWPNADADWRTAVEDAWRVADDAPASPEVLTLNEVDPARVAELVDFLFSTVHASGAPERSYEEVAGDMAAAGASVSPSDLRAWRTGRRTRLRRVEAHALAGAFGVPTSYFFDPVDAERVTAQLTAVAAIRDAGVERAALRLAGLTPKNLRIAEAMIEHLRSEQEPS